MDALNRPLLRSLVHSELWRDPLLIPFLQVVSINEVVGMLVGIAKLRRWLGGGPGIKLHGPSLFWQKVTTTLARRAKSGGQPLK